MRVCFVLGSLSALTGGNAIALTHARAAAAAGWSVTVTALQTPDRATGAQVGAGIRVCAIDEAVRSGRYDVVIATFWRTVYALPEFDAARWLYFVQSIETRFVSKRRPLERAAADMTYMVDMPVVTVGHWMVDFLRERFGRTATVAPVFVDPQAHRPDGPALTPREPGRVRVLVEGPLKMRLKNVPRTIELARRSRAHEIWLMTQSDVPFYPGVHRLLTRVPPGETGAVYRSCDVVLRLSFVEGVSLVPLEMMACGGTVVTNDVTGHDDYMRNGLNGLVVPTDDEDAAVASLDRLVDYPKLLDRLRAGALETVRARPGVSDSSAAFLAAVMAAREAPFDAEASRRMVRRFRKLLLGCETSAAAVRPVRKPPNRFSSTVRSWWTVVETQTMMARWRPDASPYRDY
jgi:hypothetical protein